MSEHDKQMPQGWHTIKSVLLKEMATAANFHLCIECADALFHARLIGESIANEFGTILQNGSTVGESEKAQDE
jgi:hypothetical protein